MNRSHSNTLVGMFSLASCLAFSTTASAADIGAADPMGGKFTIEQATEGLAGKGDLLAEIVTSRGKMVAKLLKKRHRTRSRTSWDSRVESARFSIRRPANG